MYNKSILTNKPFGISQKKKHCKYLNLINQSLNKVLNQCQKKKIEKQN